MRSHFQPVETRRSFLAIHSPLAAPCVTGFIESRPKIMMSDANPAILLPASVDDWFLRTHISRDGSSDTTWSLRRNVCTSADLCLRLRRTRLRRSVSQRSKRRTGLCCTELNWTELYKTLLVWVPCPVKSRLVWSGLQTSLPSAVCELCKNVMAHIYRPRRSPKSLARC